MNINVVVIAIVGFTFRRGIMLRGMAWKGSQDGSARQIEIRI
jgi:hypothetical protein